MKANAKYTALEILTAAKIADAAGLFGKVRIRIAGIAGIVAPDHLIKIGADIKVIDIIVGTDKHAVEIEGVEKDFVVTEDAKIALAIKGEKATEAVKTREEKVAIVEAEKAKKAEAEKAKTDETKK